MIKSLIAAITATAAFIPAAARTAADLFAAAPAAVIPTLAANTRLDMLDYFRSGLPTASANTLDGKSRITALADDAVDVQIGRDSSMQLVMLPGRSDTIVAIVETVLTPIADSSIRYYHASDWSDAKGPALPGKADFIEPERSKEARTADMPTFIFVRAEYKPDEHIFVFTNTTAAYYAESDRPDGLALMRPVLKMKYSPKKFTPVSK